MKEKRKKAKGVDLRDFASCKALIFLLLFIRIAKTGVVCAVRRLEEFDGVCACVVAEVVMGGGGGYGGKG